MKFLHHQLVNPLEELIGNTEKVTHNLGGVNLFEGIDMKTPESNIEETVIMQQKFKALVLQAQHLREDHNAEGFEANPLYKREYVPIDPPPRYDEGEQKNNYIVPGQQPVSVVYVTSLPGTAVPQQFMLLSPQVVFSVAPSAPVKV